MNVDDEVELSRILARIVPDALTKVLGTFGLPQYTLYAKKEWHPGLIRETKLLPGNITEVHKLSRIGKGERIQW